jgi:uncharacterized protein (DUF433 family)
MLQMEKHELKPSLMGGWTQTWTSSASTGTVIVSVQPHFSLVTPELLFDRIIRNPQICMGEPTIKGTRITAAFVYRLVKSGMHVKDVLDAYPQLQEEDIRQAIAFVEKTYGASTP